MVFEEDLRVEVETSNVDPETNVVDQQVDPELGLEVVLENASHDIEKTMSEVTQKHGLEKVLSKAVSENDGIDHMERVHRHGVRETGMNFSGDRWVPKLLADDACPNRKEDLEDEAIDEVLEHDRNDKVEVDVLDVMEDKIEDLED